MQTETLSSKEFRSFQAKRSVKKQKLFERTEHAE